MYEYNPGRADKSLFLLSRHQNRLWTNSDKLDSSDERSGVFQRFSIIASDVTDSPAFSCKCIVS